MSPRKVDMEYTGKYREMYSGIFNEDVFIFEYKSKEKFPWCDCDRCGRPIIKKMYVVKSKDNNTELMYLGSECIKHFT